MEPLHPPFTTPVRLQHPVPTTGALSLTPAACKTYLSTAATMAVSNQQAT